MLAATGSAIGLGNLWKFPFITWENNGGAFVLVYLICIAAVGLPIMMAELLIGRKTQKSAVGALKEALGPIWGLVGLWGVLCGFILLSYYTVIAGWSLFYFVKSVGWTLNGLPQGVSLGELFGEQVSNSGLQLALSLGFSMATVGVVYLGVQKGIERIARWFLPVLFAILVLLLISALGMSGSGEALAFIFKPNFSELEPNGILEALGHSFFTLSLGMGAMITYGSYISRGQSIVKASAVIVILDTAIALVATVIMFSVIFSVPGMREQVGGSTVGMLFISLPELFYTEVPFGRLLGPLFYVLVALAALTSTMSLLEVVAVYIIDEHGISRSKATLMCGGAIFVFTIFAALSFGGTPILPGCPSSQAVAFAEDILARLAALHFGWGSVTASAGVAEATSAMGSPDVLLAAADHAMYVAKEAGRNCVRSRGRAVRTPPTERPTSMPAGVPERATALADIRVLLVDDDAATLRATRRMLTKLGASVVACSSPREALDHVTSGEGFDLVATDIVMPEMSGFTLVDLATRVLPNLPALYLSGYTQEDVYWGATPGQRSAFLTKPITFEDLTTTIGHLLGDLDSKQESVEPASERPEADSRDMSGERPLAAGHGVVGRVLVVDDDATVVRAMVRLLRKAGHPSPVGLTDPRHVVSAIKEHDIDLIVLDLNMPEMDGFSVMAEVARFVGPSEYLPILVFTGDADIESKRRVLASGAMDFLQKPFDWPEAQARVQNLLHTRRLTQTLHGQKNDLESVVAHRTIELEDARTEVLHRLARAAEYRDDITGRHANGSGSCRL